MADEELVVSLGAEGGGASIFRVPSGSGGWSYRVSGSSMRMDEDDIDYWESWQKPAVATLQEALESVASGDVWAFLSPSDLHPDYRETVWRLVQEAHGRCREGSSRFQERRLEDWRRLCFPGQEPPDRRG